MRLHRRRYLRGVLSSGLAIAIAGCFSDIDGGSVGYVGSGEERTANLHSFSEVIEYRGVEVAPTDWTTVGELTYRLESGESKTVSSPDGSILLLTRIEVKFVGTQSGCCPGAGERLLPARASTNDAIEDVQVTTDGSTTSPGPYEASATGLGVEGYELLPYERARRTNDADESVRPGIGFAGWIVTELVESFDPETTELKVRWGASGPDDGESIEPSRWQYRSEPISVETAAALQNETTIVGTTDDW